MSFARSGFSARVWSRSSAFALSLISDGSMRRTAAQATRPRHDTETGVSLDNIRETTPKVYSSEESVISAYS